MSNLAAELRRCLRILDRGAARLNPGLCAVAIILSSLLLAEAAARLPALYDEDAALRSLRLTADPTALAPADLMPD